MRYDAVERIFYDAIDIPGNKHDDVGNATRYVLVYEIYSFMFSRQSQ